MSVATLLILEVHLLSHHGEGIKEGNTEWERIKNSASSVASGRMVGTMGTIGIQGFNSDSKQEDRKVGLSSRLVSDRSTRKNM